VGRRQVKQRVLLRLGRLDELLANGQVDSLIQSLGRFSEKLAVLGAHASFRRSSSSSMSSDSTRLATDYSWPECWHEKNGFRPWNPFSRHNDVSGDHRLRHPLFSGCRVRPLWFPVLRTRGLDCDPERLSLHVVRDDDALCVLQYDTLDQRNQVLRVIRGSQHRLAHLARCFDCPAL
jgi:hypothetical protein